MDLHLHRTRLGFSYVLSRLRDPGGVRATPNVPIDQSRTLAPSRYPYTPCKGHLVNLTSLQCWQDIHTFHVKLDVLIHWNNTECNTAMMKIPMYIYANIPMLTQPILMHNECCFLCMAYAYPYNRLSSHVSFTVSVTSYIRVSQILDLCMETTSPYKGPTPSSYFQVTLSHIWVMQNTTLATSNHSSNVNLTGSTIRAT